METDKILMDDLQEQHRELAAIIGIDNLIKLSNHFGGTQIYVPQTEKLIKNVIYRAVIEEFDGTNIKILAKKYDISESTVYRLVRDKILNNQIQAKQIEGQMSFDDYGI